MEKRGEVKELTQRIERQNDCTNGEQMSGIATEKEKQGPMARSDDDHRAG